MRSPSFTEDWSQFDPSAYLDEYYGDLGAENLALLHFLVREIVCLDVGCCGCSHVLDDLDLVVGDEVGPVLDALALCSILRLGWSIL